MGPQQLTRFDAHAERQCESAGEAKVEDGKRQTESESFGISHFPVVAKILGKRFDILPTKELIICALNGTASRPGKQSRDGVEGQWAAVAAMLGLCITLIKHIYHN